MTSGLDKLMFDNFLTSLFPSGKIDTNMFNSSNTPKEPSENTLQSPVQTLQNDNIINDDKTFPTDGLDKHLPPSQNPVPKPPKSIISRVDKRKQIKLNEKLAKKHEKDERLSTSKIQSVKLKRALVEKIKTETKKGSISEKDRERIEKILFRN